MNAKQLKAAVSTESLDLHTVAQLNKIPLTRRQSESFYVEIEGLGRVETTDVIRKTNFKPADFKMTLHFGGVSCPLAGEMVWEAFGNEAAEINRRVEIQEDVRHPNV